jgi:hypothetical protein
LERFEPRELVVSRAPGPDPETGRQPPRPEAHRAGHTGADNLFIRRPDVRQTNQPSQSAQRPDRPPATRPGCPHRSGSSLFAPRLRLHAQRPHGDPLENRDCHAAGAGVRRQDAGGWSGPHPDTQGDAPSSSSTLTVSPCRRLATIEVGLRTRPNPDVPTPSARSESYTAGTGGTARRVGRLPGRFDQALGRGQLIYSPK